MIISLEDKNIINKILPLHCESYFKQAGWSKIGHIENIASVWKKDNVEGAPVITLPMLTDIADYPQRIYDMIVELQRFEKRPLESIITDLLHASMDTFRITAFKDRPEINLPLKDASILINRSIDMIASVAQSLSNPMPFFQSRYSNQVDDFLSKIRMGHTERGSFIVTINIPIQPRLNDALFYMEGEEVFERKVMLRLARLTSTAIEAANTLDAETFKARIRDGMNANFCESIADIADICGDDGANFNIAWAPSRPILPQNNVHNHFLVRRDTSEVLREAGRLLRTNVTESDITIKGYVIRLDRSVDATKGEIKILDTFSDKPRSVFIELDSEQYKLAVDAHKAGKCISIKGNLDKSGRTQTLTSIRDLIILEDDNVCP